jgi:apolipoprotein D and lipocalin family protein
MSKKSLTAFLLVAFVFLTGCTGVPSGTEPVAGFDINRYKGTWYEIARLDHPFERGLTNVTATYTLLDDGTVGVLNRGFDSGECKWKETEGIARFQGDADVASLSVSFFGPFAGGYHVLELDKKRYAYALVAGPSRDYLWILARSPNLSSGKKNELINKARELDFPVDQLIMVDHAKPDC